MRAYKGLLFPITIIMMELLLITMLITAMTKAQDHHYETKLSELRREVDSTLHIQKDRSKIFYTFLVSDPVLMRLLSESVDADFTQQRLNRELIHKQVTDLYKQMRVYTVRQFHFHTIHAESFLRIHKPKKYGDSLIGVRHSIEQVNKTKKAIHGFEEGRIYNGFRNVYPLSYEGRHIGSVEISFAFEAIQSQLESIFTSNYRFIVSKAVVDEKVFDDMRTDHYISSTLSDDFYFERKLQARTRKHDGKMAPVIAKINGDLKGIIKTELQQYRPFYKIISIDANDYLVRYIPVHNIQGGNVAYIVSYTEDDSPVAMFDYISYFILINLFLLVIFVLAKYLKNNREYEFIQEILDTQDHIVVVTDGNEVKMTNQMFLDFFDVESRGQFLKTARCICDKFLPNDAFFHLGKIAQRETWVKELSKMDETRRIVAMMDQRSHQIRVFSVFIRPLTSIDYDVLTFSDITQISEESRLNAHRAMHDELTGISNRASLNTIIKAEIEDLRKREKSSGILMFDIDHFKHINDTYGHLAGDYVLITLTKEVSKLLRRSNDSFGRWGGEEFMIILPDTYSEKMQLIAEKIRIRIESIQFSDMGKVTCSFGATLIQDDDTMETLTRRLDGLLYQAKSSGRNTTVTG